MPTQILDVSEAVAPSTITRRNFIQAAGAASAGVLLAPQALAAEVAKDRKRRYAIVGVGSRYRFFSRAINKRFAEHCELVAFCDNNAGRLKLAQSKAQEETSREIPIYADSDFDRLVAETKPDVVIVTTDDGSHHHYIVRAMQLGCDVMTEKPMTIDAAKCQQILDTQRETGKQCRVTFNYRYSPPRTQLKEMLMSGVIGEVLSVDFHWMLNTSHGADYFRRWHSQKDISGGLMVHKATHHFDLVNWWLSAVPVEVYATGKREYYTPAMAKRMGLSSHHERCHTCPEKDKCGFELDLAGSKWFNDLYLQNEKYDGYFRDRCVFRPDIDIEDTMNVLVKYDNGVTLCYSLNAFNSWEGYTIVFNGTKGRIEHRSEEQVYIFGATDTPGALKKNGTTTHVYPLRTSPYEIDVWSGEGGHGGGDNPLLEDLFAVDKQPDKYQRAADHRAGAYSILTGVAANECFKTNRPVRIDELVKGLSRPEYAPMPSRTDSLAMPRKG